jgi:hypothetical protein
MIFVDIGGIVLATIGFIFIIVGLFYSKKDYDKSPPQDGTLLGLILTISPWYITKIFFIFMGVLFFMIAFSP